MNKFYKGYDDITASPEFKSRMVRALRGSENKTETKTGGLRIKKRTLAVLIAAAVLVLAIGTAAAATIIGRNYETPSAYMMQSKDEREQTQQAIPDVENVIAKTKPETGDYSIVMLPEMEKADELNEWRQKMGQPVYSEQDWGWIRDIRPEIEEVLIDDRTLAFNVRLHTDHGMAFAWGHEGEGQHVEALCDGLTYTVEETGKTSAMLYPSGATLSESVSENGATINTDLDAYSLTEPFPTDGKVRVTMIIGVRDKLVDDMGFAGLLANITYTFEFDASAGGDVAKPVVTERALSGSIVLTEEDEEGREYNKRVLLDGVVLLETVHYRSTGIYVSYSLKSAPDGWTDRDISALLKSSFESPSHYGLTVVCVPKGSKDAQEVLKPGYPSITPAFEYTGILPLFPSEYEAIKAKGYELRIGFRYVTAFNDRTVGEDWRLPEGAGVDYGYDLLTTEQPIASFNLILP